MSISLYNYLKVFIALFLSQPFAKFPNEGHVSVQSDYSSGQEASLIITYHPQTSYGRKKSSREDIPLCKFYINYLFTVSKEIMKLNIYKSCNIHSRMKYAVQLYFILTLLTP